LTPSILGGYNFFNFISFLTIFNALETPIKKVQILFRHQKQWSLSLESSLPERFGVIVVTQLQLNLQLRNN
jgi:hypothetical protein